MEARENIVTHSEELGEVLGTPPRWLVRWGTMIACFGFCVLLAAGYFVKYPDVIEATLVLTAPNPPVNLISDRSGLVEAVLVKDNEQVKQGDLLLVYSSTASMIDIDSLEADLQYFSGEVYPSDLEQFSPKRNLQLGALQAEYSAFLRNFDAFTYGSTSNNDQKSINRLQRQIRDIEANIQIESGKRNGIDLRARMADNEYERLQNNYATDPDRYRELLGAKAKEIKEIQQEYTNLEAVLDRRRLDIKNIERDIASLRQQSGADNTNRVFLITENINRLKGQVKAWKNENLLFAPIEGQVVFYEEFDHENQSVQEGNKILQIISPGDVGEMYGKVDLPQRGSGKVEVGQTVVIKFDNYPHHEYGMINGQVTSKSDFPQEDNTYKVEVSLPDGLRTSFGRELKFNQGMQGSAEIVTKKRRFLFRLFENVFSF